MQVTTFETYLNMTTINKMTADEFENMVNKMISSNYSSFCDILYSINLNTLSEEQEKKIFDLFSDALGEDARTREEDYKVRQIAMKHIMELDFETFQERMENKWMPAFIRSKRGDNDYVSISRDDNQVRGWQRAYSHRGNLLFTEYEDFVAENVLTDCKYMEYATRKNAMKIISDYTEEEFAVAILENTVPTFVRAVRGDPDYILLLRDISASPGNEWLYWNRSRLRTTELEDFVRLY